jgi:hypothetical protein
MATWVRCTDKKGQVVHINLDNATELMRDEQGGGTVITLLGGGIEIVREPPEEILKKAKPAI